jgi:hypothetical protein
MFELAQQLSYYLSVVDGGATSKLVAFGQRLASVSIIAQTAQASLAGMIAPLQAASSAWSGREQQINNVTRSLRQYQYVGQSVAEINREITASMPGATAAARAERFTQVYQQQFNNARATSRGVVAEMGRMAAILPGEMNDYMQSFSQNLPHLSRVRGMNLGRAVNLTSMLQAGAISSGIDAGQAARDLTQALTVGVHAVDRSWSESWSQYARFNGRSIGASQFNALTQVQKVQVLEDIAEQLRPQMDATGDAFEATMGTFNSLRHELYLGATEPLFDAWKHTINTMNGVMGDFGPRFLIVAQFFTGALASRIKAFADRIPAMATSMADFGERMLFFAARLNGVVNGLQAMGSALRDMVTQNLPAWRQRAGEMMGGAGVGARAGANSLANIMSNHGTAIVTFLLTWIPAILFRGFLASMGPIGFILPGLFARIFMGANRGEILGQFFAMIGNVLSVMAPLAVSLWQLYDAVMTFAAVAISHALPFVFQGISMLATAVSWIAQAFTDQMLGMVVFVGQELTKFGYMLAITYQLLRPVGWALYEIFLRPIIDIARALGMLDSEISDGTQDFHQVVSALQQFYVALRRFMDWLGGEEANEGSGGRDADPRATATNLFGDFSDAFQASMPDWAQNLQNSLRANQQDTAFDGTLRPHAPDARRPSVHQDFRYSRFDITQKFADGFSPERVAAAFVGDLESMASQRLSSGFAPAFSNG